MCSLHVERMYVLYFVHFDAADLLELLAFLFPYPLPVDFCPLVASES